MYFHPKEKKAYRGRSVFVAGVVLAAVCFAYAPPVSAEDYIEVPEEPVSADVVRYPVEETNLYAGRVSVIKRVTEQELLRTGEELAFEYRLERVGKDGKAENIQYRTVYISSEDYQVDTEGYVSGTAEFGNLKDADYRLFELCGNSYDMEQAGSISSNAEIASGSVLFHINSAVLENKNDYQGSAVFITKKQQILMPEYESEENTAAKSC